MLTLITAKNGGGKSQLAVKLLVEQVKQGRRCFSNINGLEVDEIQRRYGGIRVEPSPADWRDTPEGSYIQYDEAQELFPSTGKPGRPDDPVLQALEKHRHTGHDLVYITQEPTFIHHHIRKLIGEHKALHRAMNRKGAAILTWENRVGDPEDFHSRKLANTENFSYSQEWQTLYKSSSKHTYKFKMPSRLLWIAAAIVAVLAWPAYLVASGQFLDFDGENTSAKSAGLSGSAPQAETAEGVGGGAAPVGYPWASSGSRVAPINGCSSGRHCRCWDFDGQVIDMEDAACRNLAEGRTPMPLDLNLFRQSTGVVASEGGGGEGG